MAKAKKGATPESRKTMIVMILDRSGSMSGRESDVVGGVNKFIDEQKAGPGEACLSLVRFDDQAVENFRPMENLKDSKHITVADFQPRGMTPLLDAVGRTIASMDEDWKREKPDLAICVIVTDGQENASHEYTKAKIREMIEAREKSLKWAFVYLGADPNSFADAGSIGVTASKTAMYSSTRAGTVGLYTAASASVSSMRFSGSNDCNTLGGVINDDGTVDTTPPSPPTAAPSWTPPVGSSAATSDPAPASTWTPPA